MANQVAGEGMAVQSPERETGIAQLLFDVRFAHPVGMANHQNLVLM
jgi:hypothetical protein